MYPLLFTISLLSLLGIMTSSIVSSYYNTCKERYMHVSTVESMKTIAALEVKGHVQEIKNQYQDDLVKEPVHAPKGEKKQKPSKRYSRRLEFDFKRPSNNSRLNFYLLLNENDREVSPLTKYELAALLLRNLYGHTARFKAIPRPEYKILDTLLLKKEETREFKFPDQLAEIHLDDPFLTSLFHQMLKGGLSQNGDIYPCLLHYITFDKYSPDGKGLSSKTRKLNLLFISPELLNCLVPDNVYQDLLHLRTQMWQEILDQETHRKELEKNGILLKNRSHFEREFKEKVKFLFDRAGLTTTSYSDLFDYSLGKIGNIWLIRDSETGVVTREKVEETWKKKPDSNKKTAVKNA